MRHSTWSDHAANLAYVGMVAMMVTVIYVQNRDRIDPLFQRLWWEVQDQCADLWARVRTQPQTGPFTAVERQVMECLKEKAARERSDSSSSSEA